jgi:D-alanyl-D-alanine carboxypeptidase
MEAPGMGSGLRLVGRAAEVDLLCGLVVRAAHGQLSAALVEGEPGIGKSRVVAQALAYARDRGVRVFRGECDEIEQGRPLGALAHALGVERGAPDQQRSELARRPAHRRPMTIERKLLFALAALAVTLAGACSGDDRPQAAAPTTVLSAAATTTDATRELTAIATDVLGRVRAIPGLLLHVDAPGRGVDVSVAVGLDDRTTTTPLAADAGVRIASNTKTFVAASVLRLGEEGALALDDPVARHLALGTVASLRGGGYDPDRITVRHLLLHTSGVYNVGQDPAYQAAVGADPNRRWTRTEQVQWAMDHGAPVGAPGERFAYSDTGYTLLAEIVESASGRPLPDAVRTLLDFEGLGLDETYWEPLEPAPAGAAGRAHQYIGSYDGFDMDPSFDPLGAAGLVSTVDDLSAFYRSLLSGEVFDRDDTLATMLEIPASNAAEQAGMGIFRHDLAGATCWGHAGFWGNLVLTCPEVDVTVATSILQDEPGPGYDEDAILLEAFEVGRGR